MQELPIPYSLPLHAPIFSKGRPDLLATPVQKHYKSSNMQNLQKEAKGAGVVWLSVISSAPGEQGHVAGARADELTASRQAMPTAVLLDPQGAIGKTQDARTTPHMFVIDAKGVLRYAGGIDSIASNKTADIEKADPLFKTALSRGLTAAA